MWAHFKMGTETEGERGGKVGMPGRREGWVIDPEHFGKPCR